MGKWTSAMMILLLAFLSPSVTGSDTWQKPGCHKVGEFSPYFYLQLMNSSCMERKIYKIIEKMNIYLAIYRPTCSVVSLLVLEVMSCVNAHPSLRHAWSDTSIVSFRLSFGYVVSFTHITIQYILWYLSFYFFPY